MKNFVLMWFLSWWSVISVYTILLFENQKFRFAMSYLEFYVNIGVLDWQIIYFFIDYIWVRKSETLHILQFKWIIVC